MKATELFHADGKTSGIFYCGECRAVKRTEDEADACCVPPRMPVCPICNKSTERIYEKSHSECVEAKRLQDAEKLDGWDGWIFAGDGIGWQEGYFDSLTALVEWLEGEYEGEWPEFVHVCNEVPFKALDLDGIIEDLTSDMCEDAEEYLKGVDGLRAAIDAFNEANVGFLSYEPDYKRAVRVPKPSVAPSETAAHSGMMGIAAIVALADSASSEAAAVKGDNQ